MTTTATGQLTFADIPTPKARASDPIESHLAAQRMRDSGAAANHRQMILDALAESRVGMTGKQIGERCGLTNVQVLRRTKELRDSNKIRSVSIDGQREQVHELV